MSDHISKRLNSLVFDQTLCQGNCNFRLCISVFTVMHLLSNFIFSYVFILYLPLDTSNQRKPPVITLTTGLIDIAACDIILACVWLVSL